MNILGDFIKRVNSLYPEDIDNEELNSLLTTIKNQGEEIAELHKEVDKLQAKAEKAAKTVKAEPKAAPKKAAAKKPAAKKTTARKAPAKKVVAKKEVSADVYVQFMGMELPTKEIVANVKKAWAGMTGKKEEDIKELQVYVKPEENKAYYVVNGEADGNYIDL